MNDYVAISLDHLPFVLAVSILWTIGTVAKTLARPAEASRAWALWWKTLPLHPVITGGLFGLLAGVPLPESVRAWGALAGCLYFAGAGVVAAYAHDLVRTYLKYRTG